MLTCCFSVKFVYLRRLIRLPVYSGDFATDLNWLREEYRYIVQKIIASTQSTLWLVKYSKEDEPVQLVSENEFGILN
ncbi:hypothetical protein TWF970_011393 [Orbilia oligospora]|uniref:Uncharacterized protein n=1 Tax=Orbilia oligospora TaxID=2813651 RepID=A0A7C8VLI8_ORBOL|nr:hypothetical protein TWF970_011393 [Orbilia oligospora]